MHERMSYRQIRTRLQTALQDLPDPDSPALLEKCCHLLASLALGTEGALMDQTSVSQQDDLRTLLHHLSVLYSAELRLLRAAQAHHAAEIRRHGVPEDVVHAAATQRLYRDFCGILRVPEPPAELPWGAGMTTDAFFAVFPGAGWLTAPEVVARLDRAHYGGDTWAQASVDAKVAHVAQMVRYLTETEAARPPRHVGESAHLRDGYLQRVYKAVEEFTDADWEDVRRYHERMTHYYQGQMLDLLPTLVEHHPEGFGRLDLRI
jgi:hypothetical protein